MTPKDDPKRWLRGTCQQSLGTQSLGTSTGGSKVSVVVPQVVITPTYMRDHWFSPEGGPCINGGGKKETPSCPCSQPPQQPCPTLRRPTAGTFPSRFSATSPDPGATSARRSWMPPSPPSDPPLAGRPSLWNGRYESIGLFASIF